MNKKLLFTMILLAAGIVYGAVYIEFFYATSRGDEIVLEWKVKEDSAIEDFAIERAAVNYGFVEIVKIKAVAGKLHYEYVDKTAYKSSEVFYKYRIKIIEKNGLESFSNEVNISHNPSGVKRTWGSIKAMFR